MKQKVNKKKLLKIFIKALFILCALVFLTISIVCLAYVHQEHKIRMLEKKQMESDIKLLQEYEQKNNL